MRRLYSIYYLHWIVIFQKAIISLLVFRQRHTESLGALKLLLVCGSFRLVLHPVCVCGTLRLMHHPVCVWFAPSDVDVYACESGHSPM